MSTPEPAEPRLPEITVRDRPRVEIEPPKSCPPERPVLGTAAADRPAARAERPPRFMPYVCPLCGGRTRWESGERCLHCGGAGYVTAEDIAGWEDEAVLAPVPPGVMRAPCVDCAYRPGSMEREDNHDQAPEHEGPFYCHTGMEQPLGEYLPVAWYRDAPLGYLVCRGWWNHATGTGEQPDELGPYRERGST